MSDASQSPLMTAEQFVRLYGNYSVKLVDGRLNLPSQALVEEITRMNPALTPLATPALMTVEEFVRRYSNQRVELVKGVVKELPMPFPKHGKICVMVVYLLTDFA